MVGFRTTIEVKGLAELKRKLPGEPTIPRRALRPVMRSLSVVLQQLYRAGAPVGTGRLVKSARRRSSLFQAKVLFNPVARDGKFRYGWALNSNARWHHQGYLERIKDKAAQPASNAVRELGRLMEQEWQR